MNNNHIGGVKKKEQTQVTFLYVVYNLYNINDVI
jgi:hypothetical protein